MEDAPPLDPETAEESQNSEIIDEPVSKPEETSPEPPVTVSGGRRRGRRKVMKKKTIKDEEGYLGGYDWYSKENQANNRPSHEGRACMGVLFGRRASAIEGEDALLVNGVYEIETREWKAGTR